MIVTGTSCEKEKSQDSHPDFIYMAPEVRFELTANRLTADCSTTELLGNKPS